MTGHQAGIGPLAEDPLNGTVLGDGGRDALVWCCMLDGTNKTDGFLFRARHKPQPSSDDGEDL